MARQASAPRRRDVRLTTRPAESPSRSRYPRMHVAIRVDRKVFYWVTNPNPDPNPNPNPNLNPNPSPNPNPNPNPQPQPRCSTG